MKWITMLCAAFVAAFALSQTNQSAAASNSAAVTVTITPTNASVPLGNARQFSATISGAANQTVVWSVNGVVGGNTQTGEIDQTGKYTAPAVLPPNQTVTVKAASAADNTASASASVLVRHQVPYITSVSPAPIAPGNFTLTVTGSRFALGAKVLFNNAPLQTTFVSSTQLTAAGNAAQLGGANIAVANPGTGAVSTNLSVNVASVITVTVTPASVAVNVGATQQFQASVTNAANQSVVWSVNGITGGNAASGTIDGSGKYTAPQNLNFTGTVSIMATSAADNVTKSAVVVALKDPDLVSVGRFLDQTTFGTTPVLLAQVKPNQFEAFLENQFTLPESVYPGISTATTQAAVDRFFSNAAKGNDQLRQRTVYALSQIFVTSVNKNPNADQMIPWLRILSRNAFGNYRTLLREMTLDASMGHYLDLANSNKPGLGSGANENYARELMQLFSIGLYELNQDGSLKLDANNHPTPTYAQNDIRGLSLALTGWTYATAPGANPAPNNWAYYTGVMEARPANHATGAKTFLGNTLPAGQTIQEDLDDALDVIFNHPNVAPFVSTRLIRAFVKSNPSPAYIARIASVFDNNGAGVRGDLRAVLKAILLDTEARNDQPDSNAGRLRSPLQHTVAMFRALNGNVAEPLGFGYKYKDFGEELLSAPTVFGHYSPLYRLPKNNNLFAPEFQIYTPTEAVNRANFIYSLLAQNGFDIAPFVAVAASPAELVNAVDNRLLYGRMSPEMRQAIHKALQSSSADNKERAITAIYLVVTSGDYLVQN